MNAQFEIAAKLFDLRWSPEFLDANDVRIALISELRREGLLILNGHC
jgi:hypothetical protein